jgi:acyl-CoA synthetase (AMP-forming)/AMP-acid ligase II
MLGEMLRARRDLKRAVRGLWIFPDSSNETIALQLQRHAQRQPDTTFLRYAERSYSYAEANAAINRHAHAYRALGIGRGDVVALLLENRPEQLWHLFGLHKLGAVTSLINTHLVGDALAYALRACEPRRVVVGSELWTNFSQVQQALEPSVRGAVHVDLDSDGAETAEHTHDALPAGPLFGDLVRDADESNPPEAEQQRLGDLAAYIYTSGTTGKPKPALVRHNRFFRAGAVWSTLAIRYRPGDVMYNCLPLYHANGVVLATSSVITSGVTLALARRFSRTRFWDDIRKYRATSFIYIGELCRYLMNNPPTARDRDHAVRAITGNGLRPDIWAKFQTRFGVERVAEFYGATEGNCVTLNLANVLGSVGPMMPGMRLAKWDESRQEFKRDADGFMMGAEPGEPGILLGRIRHRRAFDGYRDASESARKVIANAFEPGDAYFNSGDLLRRDWRFHLFFSDRVGDTFRWKGENVSTTEVQEQISQWPAVAEVNVYGVEVPGTEGRAGMAALVLANGRGFDPDAFKQHVDARLPAYARPLFVRLSDAIETTGTLKMKKTDLQKQGFDVTQTSDPIYFHDARLGAYVPLDPALAAELSAGRVKL